MNAVTTRLSVVLALACMIGSSILPVNASAQDPDQIELDFPVDEEFSEGVAAAGAAAGLVAMFMMVVYFAVIVLVLASLWKVFSKAGKPGWAAIIPIYNMIVWLEICGRPIWWIILLLIPCVNIVIALLINIDLAKSFGKDVGFGIGLWLLGIIFLPILAFGKSQYVGPAAPQ